MQSYIAVEDIFLVLYFIYCTSIVISREQCWANSPFPFSYIKQNHIHEKIIPERWQFLICLTRICLIACSVIFIQIEDGRVYVYIIYHTITTTFSKKE